MAKKYNKINKEQILELFKEKPMITRKDVTDKYNCSVYSVRILIEVLQDDKIIKLSCYGYKLQD